MKPKLCVVCSTLYLAVTKQKTCSAPCRLAQANRMAEQRGARLIRQVPKSLVCRECHAEMPWRHDRRGQRRKICDACKPVVARRSAAAWAAQNAEYIDQRNRLRWSRMTPEQKARKAAAKRALYAKDPAKANAGKRVYLVKLREAYSILRDENKLKELIRQVQNGD